MPDISPVIAAVQDVWAPDDDFDNDTMDVDRGMQLLRGMAARQGESWSVNDLCLLMNGDWFFLANVCCSAHKW
jgi:hypothetical protein